MKAILYLPAAALGLVLALTVGLLILIFKPTLLNRILDAFSSDSIRISQYHKRNRPQ